MIYIPDPIFPIGRFEDISEGDIVTAFSRPRRETDGPYYIAVVGDFDAYLWDSEVSFEDSALMMKLFDPGIQDSRVEGLNWVVSNALIVLDGVQFPSSHFPNIDMSRVLDNRYSGWKYLDPESGEVMRIH